ncbi:MAG TPA: hypothetical protein PK195_08485, partial [Ignavibacteriaceae bacterium]|nr:hypothetical protein [Ignavibacteriaceae bacterium]
MIAIIRKLKYTLLLFVIVFSFTLTAQTTDSQFSSELYPFVVDSIQITGNEITEPFIILRELN